MARSDRDGGRGSRPPLGRGGDVDDVDDRFDDDEPFDDDEDEDEPDDGPPARRAAPRANGRRGGDDRARPARRGGGRVDFRDFDQEEASVDEGDDDRAPRRARANRSAPRVDRPAKLTLLDLCTPVFACAALLPREGSSTAQPSYLPFREQVLNALKGVELRAADNDIDAGDARAAVYALSMFIDERINDSEWIAKGQWAGEPLGIVLQQDPDGGVHFFDRLDALSPRQNAVKEVYLVCLALGFRGKYVNVDPAQQAQELSELRQKVLRSMVPTPMVKQKLLFPSAYNAAAPIADPPQRPPTWWIVASLSVAAVCLLIYLLFLWWAGSIPEPRADLLSKFAGVR